MNPTFADYQVRAHETAGPYLDAVNGVVDDALDGKDPRSLQGFLQLAYVTLGLAGEAGELPNKVKKVLRDHKGELTPEMKAALIDELGDILWYLSEVATLLGVNLGVIAQANIGKLKDRQQRGVLGGSGDTR